MRRSRPEIGEMVEVSRTFPVEKLHTGEVVSLLSTQFVYIADDGNGGIKHYFCNYAAGGDTEWRAL